MRNFRIFFSCFIVIVFQLACKKDAEMDPAIAAYESSQREQLKIIAQVGFGVDDVILRDSVAAGQSGEPLIFNSVAEAKAFFRPLIALQNVTYSWDGSEAKRSKFINVVKYVKENINVINSWTEEYILNSPYIIQHSVAGPSSRDGGGGCMIDDEPFRLTDDGCGGGGQSGKPTAGVADMTRWVLWAGYNLSFNYTFGTTGTLAVTNVTTNLVGFTAGISWTTSTTQVFTNYPGSALIYFDVSGYQNYNLIVEGIGTLFTQKVHLTGVYNTNTGTYTIIASS